MSALFSAMAVAELSGATYRQVDYWTRLGALTPLNVAGTEKGGTGRSRVYDAEAIAVARGLRMLVQADVEEIGHLVARAVKHGKAVLPRGFSLHYDGTGQTP